MTTIRHVLSILILPVTVTIVVPAMILGPRSSALPAWPGDPWSFLALAAGVVAIGCGLALVVACIRQFATVGRGTLAPWDPPKHLVVAGLYRHVRNPMITGVILVLTGETLAFRSPGLLGWLAVFVAMNLIYIPLLEEAGLEARFGDEYREYRRNVPRWVPRREPWSPPWAR